MQTQLKQKVAQAGNIKAVESIIDQYAVEQDLKMSQRNELYSEAVAHYKASRQFFAPVTKTSEKNGKTYISFNRGVVKTDGSRELKRNKWNEVLNCEINELKQLHDAVTKYLNGKLEAQTKQ